MIRSLSIAFLDFALTAIIGFLTWLNKKITAKLGDSSQTVRPS